MKQALAQGTDISTIKLQKDSTQRYATSFSFPLCFPFLQLVSQAFHSSLGLPFFLSLRRKSMKNQIQVLNSSVELKLSGSIELDYTSFS